MNLLDKIHEDAEAMLYDKIDSSPERKEFFFQVLDRQLLLTLVEEAMVRGAKLAITDALTEKIAALEPEPAKEGQLI